MEASSGDRPRTTLLNLPPGFHFAPTDAELIVHYLRRRIDGFPPLLPIFKDVTSLHGQRPEQVTEKFKDCGCGEDRWFFFTKRRRKYARGNRPDRMTSDKGFWKATGPQRMIRSGKEEERRLVGRVRTLVFYTAPKETGVRGKKDMDDGKAALSSECKTSWTMYEYENLTSEKEAADKNADKLGEWVLCTIQKQKEKKDDGKESRPAVANKVKDKEIKIKGDPKIKADGKKRKGKQEEPAENGTDQQALHPKKRSKAPAMPPSHPEMAAPAREVVDAMGMLGFEYYNRGKSSPVPTGQQHNEPPPPCSQSQTTSPCVTGNNHYGPSMACLQEPPQSSEIMSTSVGVNYNIVSSGSNMQATPFAGNTHSFHHPSMLPTPPPPPPLLLQEAPTHMMMDYASMRSSSFSGYSNHIIAPLMMPANNTAAAHHGDYGYGSAAHNTAGLGDDLHAGVDFRSLLGTSNCGFICYAHPSAMWMNRGEVSSQSLRGYLADSSPYCGGPADLGQGRAVRPAEALPRQDQVTART